MPSNFIVTFKSNISDDLLKQEEDQLVASGGTITHRYTAAIKGFAVEIPDESVNTLSSLSQKEHCQGIEADGEVSTQGHAFLKSIA